MEKIKPKLVLDSNRRIMEIPVEEYDNYMKIKEKQLQYQMSRLEDNIKLPVKKEETPKKKKTLFVVPDF